MRIVIDIPEDHKRVIDNLVTDGKLYLLPHEVEDTLAKAVKIGIILPKGHGDLIDVNKKITVPIYDEQYEEWSEKTLTVREVLNWSDEGITVKDVVIPADDAESEVER